MTLKRYTFDPDCSHEIPCQCSMEECKQGEYVLYEDYEAETARAAALQAENLELKRVIVDTGLHDAGCDIGTSFDDPDYFGECNCSLLRYEEELAALEDKP